MQIAFVKKDLKLPRFAAVRYTCLNPMQENQLVIGGFTQALHEGSLGRNAPLHLSGPIDTVPNAHDEKPIHLGGKSNRTVVTRHIKKASSRRSFKNASENPEDHTTASMNMRLFEEAQPLHNNLSKRNSIVA